ncbi:secretory carrier-associated membrane protein 1-like isoform X2 [Tigriopus californicus]|nr:secretory carrier-associated membrane protein 1-like isoform X2 [Tigriopus californicus]
MSQFGFDDNPFAAPPLVTPGSAAADPFQDPSVQKATTGGGPGGPVEPPAPSDLSDYNPFEGQKTVGQSAGSGPAVMNAQSPQPQVPPPITTADFQRRQEELEERARDLERREQELRNAPYNARTNNWPPVPSFCPFQPCFYQDINVDIPVEFQKIVNYLYYLWVAHVSLLFSNMIVGLLYLFVGGDWGGTFVGSTIYFLIFSPLSFICWFRPAYKAFRDDSSFNFMVFFFVFFFQFIMSVLSSLGIGDTGSCGLITGIRQITNSESTGGQVFVGVLMLITAVGFAVAAVAQFFMLTKVHRLYKASDCTVAKAQAEFASGVMKNEGVQRAAAEAARQSAANAFNNPNNGGTPMGNNR